MDVGAQKAELRKRMRAAVAGMDAQDMARESAAVCEKLIALPEFAAARAVLFFMHMKDECDLSAAVERARAEGKRAAFPRCEDEFGLGLYVPDDAGCFITGRYGISEPDIERSSRIGPGEIDLIAVPGVAFDSRRNRLGRGAGYYDRLLARTGAYTVGVGFDRRIVSSVPCDAHDIPLDCVLTNKWIFCK